MTRQQRIFLDTGPQPLHSAREVFEAMSRLRLAFAAYEQRPMLPENLAHHLPFRLVVTTDERECPVHGTSATVKLEKPCGAIAFCRTWQLRRRATRASGHATRAA